MEEFYVEQQHLETYDKEGAVCIPNAFSEEWVDKLLSAHDRLQKLCEEKAELDANTGRRMASIGNGENLPAMTYSWTPEGHFGIRHACFYDDVFKSWLYDSPAASIVGQVTGADHVRFWWDQSFCKEGNKTKGATAWHSDIGAFSFFGEQLPSFWLALTDVGMDNAPMTTMVGSNHDKRLFRPVFGKEGVALSEGYFERDEIDKAVADPSKEKKVWTMKAGDCLLIHPYTQHASLPPKQEAGQRRIAFTSRWFGSDVVWNKREMTFDYPNDARCNNVVQGEAPPDEGFPIIWRRPQ